MTKQIIEKYLSDAIELFRGYRKMAEKAMVQVTEYFIEADKDVELLRVRLLAEELNISAKKAFQRKKGCSIFEQPFYTRFIPF